MSFLISFLGGYKNYHRQRCGGGCPITRRLRYYYYPKKLFVVAVTTTIAISSSSSSSYSSYSLTSTTNTALAMSTTTISTRGIIGNLPSQRYDYEPPVWAKNALKNPPKHGRLHLANLPTPIHKLPQLTSSLCLNGLDLENLENVNLYVKRDDMTGGIETGGNKIRKLEFLLADALANKYKSVVTIGGEQSNHCRATAAAARMVGMTPNLILRTKRADKIHSREQQQNKEGEGKGKEEESIGITGNILYDRMAGSTIFTCTPGEYGRIGSQQLVERVCHHLKVKTGNDPYPIPVGGSNGIGTWGYIEGVNELLCQWNEININNESSLDHIVFACGSGGTAAGIALGIALAFEKASSSSSEGEGEGEGGEDEGRVVAPPPQVHAIGVCDNPDYFYKHCAEIAIELGLELNNNNNNNAEKATIIEQYLRQNMKVYHGKGLGYAVNTPEELNFISQFALETGIVLDPVYSGKALYNFVTKELLDDEKKHIYEGKNILFWHTGGALGLFDKEDSIISTLSEISPTNRLDIYGKGPEFGGIDISNPVRIELEKEKSDHKKEEN